MMRRTLRSIQMGLAVAGITAGALAFAPPALAQSGELGHAVTVVLDQARIVKLPPRVATLVIGNPMIADATIQPGGLIVLTGRSAGSTNLIALDNRGAQLAAATIRVQPATDNVVRVFRGVERESYSCNPTCEPAMAIGDRGAHFDATAGQAARRPQGGGSAPR
jgi:Flp pilus assembly secretin CpaC